MKSGINDNIKYYSPIINITQLSIVVKKPNGEIYNFGNNINYDDKQIVTPEISLDFKFTCVKKKQLHFMEY